MKELLYAKPAERTEYGVLVHTLLFSKAGNSLHAATVSAAKHSRAFVSPDDLQS